jgi:hypothetical protein
MLLLLAPIRSPGYYYQQQHGYMAWPPICVDMIVKFHEFSIFFKFRLCAASEAFCPNSKPGLLPAAAMAIWPGYSLWDSSKISLKHGPSSGQSFSVKNPYFLSKW